MHIGWVDFTEEERDRIRYMITQLADKGAVDELGIGSLRDGFSNLLFPGISTIQTRAKYFLIVPYALLDLEQNFKITDPDDFLKTLDKIEEDCSKRLGDVNGVIGRSTHLRYKEGMAGGDDWIKRSPSKIYWGGLRQYGILTGKPAASSMSLGEYAKYICERNRNNSQIEHEDRDDFFITNWLIPSDYRKEWWKEDLDIELSQKEAEFLKDRIITTCNRTLLSDLLKNEELFQMIRDCSNFYDMCSILEPVYRGIGSELYHQILSARQFSDFVYWLRVRYNFNLGIEEAIDIWNEADNDNISNHAKIVDLRYMFEITGLNLNDYASLFRFLENCKSYLEEFSEESLRKLDFELEKREVELKTASRSKFRIKDQINEWVGGKHLDYRFVHSKIVMGDIYRGLL